MKVYLDVCCFNRPFDDPSQRRVRDEANAVRKVLIAAKSGLVQLVGSQMMRIEVDAIQDQEQRQQVGRLLPLKLLRIDAGLVIRSRTLITMGFKAADAVHVASAERLNSDVFVSTDDRLLRLGERNAKKLFVRTLNVLSFVAELNDPHDEY